jgi:hypothetical protein
MPQPTQSEQTEKQEPPTQQKQPEQKQVEKQELPAKQITDTTKNQTDSVSQSDIDKIVRAIDNLTKTRKDIWKEDKHRRNVFWAWFISLTIVSCIIWGIVYANIRSQISNEISQYESSQNSDNDSDDSSNSYNGF